MKNKNLGIFILIATTIAQATSTRVSNDLRVSLEASPKPVVHLVGDKKGWDLCVDYKAWAASKNIRAEDRLYFQFDRNKHNLYVVKAKQFEECSIVDPIYSYLSTSGQIAIPIGSIGEHYYISGVGDDCKNGMKLHITVKEK